MTNSSACRPPVRRAQEAHTQADGLIREIDTIVRARQTDALLSLGPSPLNPRLWPEAGSALVQSSQSLVSELRQNIGSDIKRSEAWRNLPVILLLLAMAALLVIRGPVWIDKLIDWLRSTTRRGSGVWGFIASMIRIILPFAGLVMLVAAFRASSYAGVNLQRVLEMIPVWGAALLIVRWLADQSFNRNDDIATLPLPPSSAARRATTPTCWPSCWCCARPETPSAKSSPIPTRCRWCSTIRCCCSAP